MKCSTMLHFIRVYTVCIHKKDLQTKIQYFLKNYNLTPPDMYNGLSQVYCIKPEGKSISIQRVKKGAQWLSGRVLDSRPRGRRFKPHWRHSVVSLSKNINPSLVLVQPRKTCPFITERLLMGLKESNRTKV